MASFWPPAWAWLEPSTMPGNRILVWSQGYGNYIIEASLEEYMSLFSERLHALGYVTYRDYLSSGHWQSIKEAYRRNRQLPQHCIGCKNLRFELHHRSYVRIGHELVGDLIPLCRECHEKVHVYMKEHNTPLQHTHVALRRVLRLTKGKTKKKFRPFSKKRGMAFSRISHQTGRNS
jgi:hypothetical protein